MKHAMKPATGTEYVNWTNTVSGYTSYGEALLGLHVDEVFPDRGDFNDQHIYYLDYVGTGNPVAL